MVIKGSSGPRFRISRPTKGKTTDSLSCPGSRPRPEVCDLYDITQVRVHRLGEVSRYRRCACVGVGVNKKSTERETETEKETERRKEGERER